MAKCDYCGGNIHSLPWTCKRCSQTFCDNHRLPENHDCSRINQKNFFEPLTKRTIPKYKQYKPESYKGEDEMYIPKKHHFSFNFLRGHFSLKSFLRKYVYFRIQDDVKPHLIQFLLILLIGSVLNYIYFRTFSLNYLFIGGVNEWFSILNTTLNFGFGNTYNLLYLIINGIYYAYFYYSFILVIYNTITNLNDRDTWVMLGWFALIIWLAIHFFPQII